MPGTIAVSLTHTHGADVPTVDYSAFDFQVRYQGGEWQNIIWLNDNPPAGLVDGTVTWTGVIPPISDQLHRCEVNLEFREFRDSNPGCVLTKGASDSESQGTLFPVSLSASGCNDPEACNFVSPCGTDESCVYAEDYWTVDGDGEYDQYQGSFCEGEEAIGTEFICNVESVGQEEVPTFPMRFASLIGNESKAITTKTDACTFTQAKRVRPQVFPGALLPNYVPTSGLLTFVDVGFNRDTIADLWSSRSLTGNDISLVSDRFGNDRQAFKFDSDASQLSFFSEKWPAWEGDQDSETVSPHLKGSFHRHHLRIMVTMEFPMNFL